MPPPIGVREVPAPPSGQDWFTESEVLQYLGDISSSTLDRYIKAGRFPEGVLWGNTRKWLWSDIAWFFLGQLIQARLAAADDEPHGAPPKRQRASPDTTGAS